MMREWWDWRHPRRVATALLNWLALRLVSWSQQVARLSLQICPGPTPAERAARIADFDALCVQTNRREMVVEV